MWICSFNFLLFYKVKSFLPVMAGADVDLKNALKDGLGEKLNLENVMEDEKYIEMDLAVMDVRFHFLLIHIKN